MSIDKPTPAQVAVEASAPSNAHVVAYLRFHQGRKLDAQRALQVANTGQRYDQAIALERKRVVDIAIGQQQVVEPVRFKRDVEPGSWIDPEQRNKFSKAPERVIGFRRMDELIRLHKRGTITVEHLAAGMKLRDDYELSQGARIGATQVVVRTAGAGDGVTQVQLDALARYRAAIIFVGQRLSSILVAVVLENATVTRWAEQKSMSLSRATGYLEGAMDCLFDHYRNRLTIHDLDRARDA